MPDAHDDADVLWRVADSVATITLNRPERMNAWTWPMHAAFFELVDRADDDPEVRAVVITGAGRGFCPGMDMEFLAETSKTVGDSVERRPLTDLGALRKPVVTAINGACAGIGLVIALLSDVRFVAAGVRMTTSFTRRGLPAEFGASWLLPRVVGVGNAMDLLLSGRVIDAQEALDLGLVNRVYPAEELSSAALAYAQDLAENCSPVAMAAVKAQVAADWHRTPGESLAEATAMVAAPERRVDFREGVDSYVEKRPPNFRPLHAARRGVDVTLDGRVAMVTGAARGIGAAIAGRLAGLGASVAVCDIDEEAAKVTAKSLDDAEHQRGARRVGPRRGRRRGHAHRRRPRPDRHPGEQRRHRHHRTVHGVHRGDVGPPLGREPQGPDRVLPRGPRRAHDPERAWPYREPRIRRGKGRLDGRGGLLGHQGRRDRVHQDAGARDGALRHHRQLRVPRARRTPTCSRRWETTRRPGSAPRWRGRSPCVAKASPRTSPEWSRSS